jgi:CRP-like cAMP-binding protein
MSEKVTTKIHDHFSQYPKRTYPKGQILVFAGEEPENVFYITKGRVRNYGVSYRGDEVIVNIFKPPAFFPMSWAINRAPNKYFYKTEIETEVHIVPTDDALQFLKDNPDVTLDLLSRIYRGMDGLLGRMVHLMSSSARNRVIYELIIECQRFGDKQANGGYTLNIGEQDLAARVGLSRETVSREMKQIKARYGVVIESRQIKVPDIVALQSAIGEEV